ncbi:hypothetical protein OEV82_02335 [Caldibacillus thermolactis]|jgi:uncharacterized protein YlxW (UPF0749 family)|uniref:Uncharacterized protein n=1 Tax=Pallidibacillus thermolactis TaxID=251051 RepID=A0ABT2WC97_9BACI|nr:hypothetical protein [Pallidibacillus thermolactis]MCU9593293.1 hypothetical protein [Pallidibacillus thermolactis]MCU9602753.1 hypothetical protein [Pallidibacillus thermolactis subsp. kokeshiiformis]MED1674864.1 hypothetical protein [Pallidibacillus thermolactis subsp. kokeshiiformis]
MSEEVIWGLAGMAFVVLIVAILFIPIAKIAQTKIQTTKEEVYQKLAAEAIEAQKETNRINEKLADEISDLKEKIASIERILKEVE